MKALIRNEGETVTEQTGVEGIDWTTGAPLTSASWCDGPYTLVDNYTAPTETQEESYEPVGNAAETVAEEETVTINGVTYTKAQLRAMLGE